MKTHNIILLFLISVTIANGQTPNTNLSKYWYYKHRMEKYFMVKGNGYGKSLPASTRNATVDRNLMEWGDAANNLGYYIGFLALEYKLLSENNQNVSETVEDLFYAINQINYLDACENAGPWKPGIAKIDGLCMRDLVDRDLTSLMKNGQAQDFPLNFSFPYEGTTTEITDFYLDPETSINRTVPYDACQSWAMSIDHHTYLLVGLALVEKYIPDGISHLNTPFLDGKTSDFKKESKLISGRLWSFWYRNNWLVKHPNGDSPQIIGIDQSKPCNQYNHMGQWAAPYSYGFTRAVEKIIGGNIANFILNEYGADALALGITPSATLYSADYSLWNAVSPTIVPNIISAIIDSQIPYWPGITNISSKEIYYLAITNVFSSVEFTQAAFLNLECIANVYFSEAPAIIAFYSSLGFQISPAFGSIGMVLSLAAVESAVYHMSAKYDWDPFYTTLHKALNPNFPVIRSANERIEDFLNNASCSGTFNFRYNGLAFVSDGGWGTKRRWSSTLTEQTEAIAPGPNQWKAGLFAGYDYMFLFNLYCLKNENYVPYFKVLPNDIWLSEDAPKILPAFNPPYILAVGADYSGGAMVPSIPQVTKTNRTITSTSHIYNKNLSGTYPYADQFGNQSSLQFITTNNSQANVTYKAGEEIRLMPGFQVSYGAKFHATIEPYVCNSSGTAYQRRGNDQGKGSNPSSEEEQPPIVLAESDKQDEKGSPLERFIVYPNPNNGQFYIELESTSLSAKTEVFISDVLGKIVWSTSDSQGNAELIHKWNVDLKVLTKGVYYVTTTSDQIQKTARIVIQ